MVKHRVLYLSYDGLTDPLGQSQILPYLIGLADLGSAITIISAEKKNSFKKKHKTIEKLCLKNNIDWEPIFYSKKPPVLSTIYDLVKMYYKTVRLNKSKAFDIVHCRSYITSLIGLRLKRKLGVKFIFDMRGFYADERVDGKIWNIKKQPFKIIYNYFKQKEKEFIAEADAVVSLTYRAKDIINGWSLRRNEQRPIDVIPCCVDEKLFTRQNVDKDLSLKLETKFDLKNKFVLSYLGSIGTWYMLKEMLDFFKEFQKVKKDAVFFFITGESEEFIKKEADKINLPIDSIKVTKADYWNMPTYLSLSDASIFFIKPCFSKIASSPVKQGELMSMGIPIICNSEVGDTDKIISEFQCGNLVNEFSHDGYQPSIEYLLSIHSFDENRAIRGAQEYFSLKKGIQQYHDIYRKVLHESD